MCVTIIPCKNDCTALSSNAAASQLGHICSPRLDRWSSSASNAAASEAASKPPLRPTRGIPSSRWWSERTLTTNDSPPTHPRRKYSHSTGTTITAPTMADSPQTLPSRKLPSATKRCSHCSLLAMPATIWDSSCKDDQSATTVSSIGTDTKCLDEEPNVGGRPVRAGRIPVEIFVTVPVSRACTHSQ